MKEVTKVQKKQPKGKELAGTIKARLSQYLKKLEENLDALLDKRLVRTVGLLMLAVIQHRNRPTALLLSELGGKLLCPASGPAGTKRISNLLRSDKWEASEIGEYLLEQGRAHAERIRCAGKRVLVCHDESVLEKPESRSAEGQCGVVSSKGRRLTSNGHNYPRRSKDKPVRVSGFHWLGAVVTAAGMPFQLAGMDWWTSAGSMASDLYTERRKMLKAMRAAFPSAIHIFDRGGANATWLAELLSTPTNFILRWHTQYHLFDLRRKVKCAVASIHRGCKYMATKKVWIARFGEYRNLSVMYMAVGHPAFGDTEFGLVVVRVGNGGNRMYLLTPKVPESISQAWDIVFDYARRWDVESAFRFAKSEFGFESVRVKLWKTRMKLLQIVSLAFSFLLHLNTTLPKGIMLFLLKNWNHRTGNKCRKATCPIYRMRLALVNMFSFQVSQNSG